jgi:hypothetical protein
MAAASAGVAASRGGRLLGDLPLDALERVVGFIDSPRDHLRLQASSRALLAAYRELPAGLCLRGLTMSSVEWEDAVRVLVRRVPRLARLSLYACDIPSSALELLLGGADLSTLEALSLHECRLVRRLPAALLGPRVPLRSLALSKVTVSSREDVLRVAAAHAETLEELLIDWVDETNASAFAPALAACSRLHTLAFTNAPLVRELAFLRGLPRLRFVGLGGSRLAPEAVEALAALGAAALPPAIELTFVSPSPVAHLLELWPGLDLLDLCRPHDAVRLARGRVARGLSAAAAAFVANCYDAHKRSPLHIAVEENSVEAVEALLALGADADHRDKRGCSALFRASEYGREEAVRLLIAAGASIVARSHNFETGLFVACLKGRRRVVREILDACDDPARIFNQPEFYANGWTPVHASCVQQDSEILRMLCEAGLDARHPNSFGSAPLHTAAKLGFVEGVRVLLEVGVDVNALDHANATALDIVPRKHAEEIREALLAAGGKASRSARHAAGERGRRAAARR